MPQIEVFVAAVGSCDRSNASSTVAAVSGRSTSTDNTFTYCTIVEGRRFASSSTSTTAEVASSGPGAALGFMEAVDFSHTIDIMTQWIDDLAATRDPVEQQENLAHQMQLHRDRVLAVQGPAFFAAVRNSTQALTDELNEKLSVSLGKVECRTSLDTQFRIVKAEKFPHVTLTVEYDAKRHQIRVHRVIKKRPIDDGSVADDVCELSIGASDRVITQRRTGDSTIEPELFASAILQATFWGSSSHKIRRRWSAELALSLSQGCCCFVFA